MPAVDTERRDAAGAAAGGAAKRRYVRRMVSEIAPRYDLLNHVLSLNIDRGWRRHAIDVLGWERRPAGTYLDICAGTLDVSVELAKRPGFQGTVIAADFAEPMLRAGRVKAVGAAVRPVVADALQLPFADGAADGALVAFGVRNFEDLPRGIAGMARVLRPGGRLFVLEFSRPQRTPFKQLFRFYFHRVMPIIGRLVSKDSAAYSYLPESVDAFPQGAAFEDILRQQGLREVRSTLLTFGVATLYTARK